MLSETSLTTLVLSTFYLLSNLICALLYAWDKQAAKKHHHRLSEKTLLLWTLLSGGVMALLAQQILHHKTKKWRFQVVAIVALTIHLAIWIYLKTINN